MVDAMKDLFLVAAGCLGMVIAVVHGYLGDTKVVRPIENVPRSSKRVMRAIMFLSAVYWFAAGAVLAASPFYLGAEGRIAAALIAGAIFLSGAIANFWATRGRHFGWVLLAATLPLIWHGL